MTNNYYELDGCISATDGTDDMICIECGYEKDAKGCKLYREDTNSHMTVFQERCY